MKRPVEGEGVSFVVPVYNKAPWLARVLEQLARQRGDFEREFIFIDDGSTDESLAVLTDATKGWPDVTILTQPNRGPSHATNRGIECARMPFIKFCDADDLLCDDATGALLRALTAHEEAVLAYGDARIYDDDTRLDLEADLERSSVRIFNRPLRRLLRNNFGGPTYTLMRTAAVRACGGCDERVPFTQDYSLALRMALEGAFLHLEAPVAFVPRFAPGRLGDDQAREMRDTITSLALFLADNPGLPWRLKQFACRRVAGRCRRFAARHRRSGLAAATRLYWRANLPVLRGHADFIESCARIVR